MHTEYEVQQQQQQLLLLLLLLPESRESQSNSETDESDHPHPHRLHASPASLASQTLTGLTIGADTRFRIRTSLLTPDICVLSSTIPSLLIDLFANQ